MILEEIFAYGHKNISCIHSSTIELTKDHSVTKRGSCILGIKATKACSDLNEKTKKRIRDGKKLTIVIKLENQIDTFYGYGHSCLKLLNTNEMVFRKSDYICDRTVLILCSKASNELNRPLIEKIKGSKKKFLVQFLDDNV
ncbi:MAG: DUF371 domain-containing protein [Promethearchaeota archaeon]|nr:MAG: DUF371 domain-containing protein [Candidatus Lokiarchaeota archaeon]